MKRLSGILIIGALCVFGACNSSSNKTDSVDSANEMNAKKDTTSNMMNNDTTTTSMSGPVEKKDADFAVDAADGGMMEVQLGQYAAQNAMDQRVKDFGTMMVQDHSQANDKLKSLASQKNITLPASVSNDKMNHMNDLMKKKGKDFDKAYVNMMVDDHKKDIKKFEEEAKDGKDADVKSFASATLPTLYKHLDSIQAIKKGKNY